MNSLPMTQENLGFLVEKSREPKPDQLHCLGHTFERYDLSEWAPPLRSRNTPAQNDCKSDTHFDDPYEDNTTVSDVPTSVMILTLLTIALVVPNVIFLAGFTFSTSILASLNMIVTLSMSATLLCDEGDEKTQKKKWIGLAFVIVSLGVNGAAFAGLQHVSTYQLSLLGIATLAAVVHSSINSRSDQDDM